MRIAKSEFARRRKALMDVMEPDSIAIVPAAPERTRSRDTEYVYRQDSDFFYLTGFAEPEAVLVLIPGREHGEFVLFCRDRDPEREIWDGYRAGPAGACDQYGADDAFPVDDIDDILPGLLEGRERVYYAMGKDAGFDRQVMEWVNTIRAKVRSGATPPGEFLDLAHFLHDNRLYKSAAEIRVMREASEISARAHVRAMQYCQPDVMEYQLEAEILHEFAMAGARSPAYNSIVGGGKNGCILHYVENSAALKAGDLVLIDAGCELENYAADITRTFPVSGTFNAEQKALYELVLAAQEAALTTIKPGAHWNEPHEISVRTITQGLLDLGLLNGELDTLIEEGAYRRFYMHRIGHWLGMDVHDVGDYKVGGEWRVLEPGMVMTVEPGIYVAPDDDTVAKKWRGIGIRIEDDVLVTKNGYDILSKDVPKTVSEIEALMASAQTRRST
ncbi:Xaa-Pro aminopeptidase [Gilvimarinus agarilyticus]|uniref:Xaa-Pro aminopeptidase n=1 Tax=unclassified Gilvimarinus TaxID=2642066 RepID=UPI001C0937AF|nr:MULTISPECIES: Xaa-Pro aminopeptidase [unclassified Gilvimarinus]MBU2885788.1 Xaa-Pro aminopeptidase [Gilvimarinus agarilyticus]MDO6570642.1 Xaa-Pro aminopeptidase [Gilvimarinus sp. 2_MG-2023]MDO6746693.1 Xaa-Pro aminopeptidase [Gilvimarinus sp. 1_MG-2023]